ncbi:MAG TPA: hypothetical protein VKN36_13310 [Eudoraea sp.]|nr:hypothetical protein [Eudoraea sp.]
MGPIDNNSWLKPFKSLLLITALMLLIIGWTFHNQWTVPKTWDIYEIEEAHLPPPDSTVEIEYAPEAYYNSLPEHVIYKSYPVYAKEFEPDGYLDSLRNLDPEIVFDPNKITTEADWIRAGEEVFFWPANFNDADSIIFAQIDSDYLRGSGDKITKAGIFPYARYVIKEKGKILFGDLACANCHSRVTENGDVIIGAQGNHAFNSGFGYFMKKFNIPVDPVNHDFVLMTGTPWVDNRELIMGRTQQEVIASLMACPLGAMSRQGTAFDLPIRVPSLIGIRDIKYLDHTGLMLHRGPADLMRYAALNQGMDLLTSYDGFIPMGDNDFSELPGTKEWKNAFGYDPFRYSDAQLYALTQYIYSLKPPENPNHFPKELLDRGERVFKEEGCVTCHSPPLYTNNMLTPVNGFNPPETHFEKYDIFNVSVETDSVSALYSRRGTGYYKIPSLLGLWYRGPFFHNGELATLEDVLDPARLKDDYVPTGFKPANMTTRAVKGHDFGMELSKEDKEALIAFLKSL